MDNVGDVGSDAIRNPEEPSLDFYVRPFELSFSSSLGLVDDDVNLRLGLDVKKLNSLTNRSTNAVGVILKVPFS